MNFKSLLIASAAASTMVGAAQAADAVVMAAPEPVEYVRVCDVYGAGFFYIPGTETCLKIGGYVRFQVAANNAALQSPANGIGTWSRFALQPDARTETEWGTLRAYADLYINYGYVEAGVAPAAGVGPFAAAGYRTWTDLEAAFIELQTSSGTFRLGKADTPYSRFLNYGGYNLIDLDSYAYRNSNEISYTYTGSNGFSALLALVDDVDADWTPDFEGGLKYEQTWGYVGALAGWDANVGGIGASAAASINFSSAISGKLQVFYANMAPAAHAYSVLDPRGVAANWSVLGSAMAKFNPKLAGVLTAQWFDTGRWQARAELQWQPVNNLYIIPTVAWAQTAPADTWSGAVRFQRNF